MPFACDAVPDAPVPRYDDDRAGVSARRADDTPLG